MSDFIWLTKDKDGNTASTENMPKNAVLIAPTTPDVVRLPPQLGSHIVRVIRAYTTDCVLCDQQATHYELEHNFGVCICFNHNNPYMFYSKR